MSAPEKDGLTERLYAVHSAIFSGVSRDRFVTHVIDPPAARTVIQTYAGEGGGLVGYCAFHRYYRTIRGRRTAVLRIEAGLLPEYRGRAAAHWFGMLNALGEKLRHPFTPMVYFGTLVHPSSYRFFCKYFPRIYPRREGVTSADTTSLALEVAETFNDPPVRAENPLVRAVGWVTIEKTHGAGLHRPQRPWRQPDVLFFKEVNPGYHAGHGLVVLVPVTFANVGTAILRRLREVVRGWRTRRHIPI